MRIAKPRYGLVLCSLGLGLSLQAGCGKSGSSASEGTGGGAASTADTATAIQQKIKTDKEMAGADVKVSEQDGTISLEGTVTSVAQKDKAEQIVLETQKEKNQQTGDHNNLIVKEGPVLGGDSNGGQ